MYKFLPEILMTVCIFIYTTIYLVGIKNGKVKPILATWIFLLLASVLSILTDYKETGVSGLTANAFNIIDTLATLTIFSVVLFQKDTRKSFDQFEKWCLGIVIFIFIAWLISGQNVLAHLSVQAILLIAYLPTLTHLWKATKNTESLGMWFFDFSASSFGIIEPLKTMALLPLVFCIRSIICTVAVIAFILRINYKKLKA